MVEVSIRNDDLGKSGSGVGRGEVDEGKVDDRCNKTPTETNVKARQSREEKEGIELEGMSLQLHNETIYIT